MRLVEVGSYIDPTYSVKGKIFIPPIDVKEVSVVSQEFLNVTSLVDQFEKVMPVGLTAVDKSGNTVFFGHPDIFRKAINGGGWFYWIGQNDIQGCLTEKEHKEVEAHEVFIQSMGYDY